jgi:glycosyltransferase involved in cell wall biosynthesis
MRRKVAYVITPHGMLAPWSRAQGSLLNRWGKQLYLAGRLRKNLDHASAIHFTTSMERDLVAPMKLKPQAIIEPVGIELAEFEPLPSRGALRAREPRVGERAMILFLSRLSPQKGLDRLIPAFAEYLRQHPSDAVLVLAGPDYDGYSQVVRSLIDRSGVKERVVMTGMLRGRERIEALVDADLFVLPSHHENFGIVVAEAMAAGTPALVSREVNMWRDLESSGGGAALSGEVKELAAAMAQWMAEPQRRRAAGERGRAFALAHYNWDLIAGHWRGHYARLLER